MRVLAHAAPCRQTSLDERADPATCSVQTLPVSRRVSSPPCRHERAAAAATGVVLRSIVVKWALLRGLTPKLSRRPWLFMAGRLERLVRHVLQAEYLPLVQHTPTLLMRGVALTTY